MSIINTTINLDQFETKEVAGLDVYAPGTYRFKMMIRGNSLLSSAFLKNIPAGATVTFNYFDTTTGTESTPERYDLAGHGTFTNADSGKTNRAIISRLHNKPQLEMIVTGAPVEVGVYITVGDFFSDSLYLDGQLANLSSDKGNANVVYDPSDGKFYLTRGTAGVLQVEVTAGAIETIQGEPKQFETLPALETVPLSEETLISQVVPAGKTWRLREANVMCRAYGRLDIYVNLQFSGRLITSPAESNVKYMWNPFKQINAGDQVDLKYTQSHGPALDIAAFLKVTEESI